MIWVNLRQSVAKIISAELMDKAKNSFDKKVIMAILSPIGKIDG